jgi:hypothetical protein
MEGDDVVRGRNADITMRVGNVMEGGGTDGVVIVSGGWGVCRP